LPRETLVRGSGGRGKKVETFTLWGIQFDNQGIEQQKLCVLERGRSKGSIVEIQRIEGD
jgi:hypothetical protein